VPEDGLSPCHEVPPGKVRTEAHEAHSWEMVPALTSYRRAGPASVAGRTSGRRRTITPRASKVTAALRRRGDAQCALSSLGLDLGVRQCLGQ